MSLDFKAHRVGAPAPKIKPLRNAGRSKGGTRPITPADMAAAAQSLAEVSAAPSDAPRELGGPKGLEPTRYGDWEVDGLVSDF